MAVNDPAKPHLARLAQDVEEVPIRMGAGEFHGGRGVRPLKTPRFPGSNH
jgi:hypothetical protein